MPCITLCTKDLPKIVNDMVQVPLINPINTNINNLIAQMSNMPNDIKTNILMPIINPMQIDIDTSKTKIGSIETTLINVSSLITNLQTSINTMQKVINDIPVWQDVDNTNLVNGGTYRVQGNFELVGSKANAFTIPFTWNGSQMILISKTLISGLIPSVNDLVATSNGVKFLLSIFGNVIKVQKLISGKI